MTTRTPFQNDFSRFPQLLHKLSRLTLISGAKEDWVKCVPEGMDIFRRVKFLDLNFLDNTGFEFWKIIPLLRAFPRLRRLYLTMCCPDNCVGGKNEIQCMYVGLQLRKLKILRLNGISFSSRHQFEFVTYLLRHSNVLKYLCIRPENNSILAFISLDVKDASGDIHQFWKVEES